MEAVYTTVVIRGKRGRTRVRALVDTGADFTIVPATIARRIGLDEWGRVSVAIKLA
jgi:predicted aspartyl protease